MKLKGLKRAFSAFLAIFMLMANVYAIDADNSFEAEGSYMGIGKIVMDMTVSSDELEEIKAEAKAELEALEADSAYNLSLVDLAESVNAIYGIVDNAATEIGAEIVSLPYNNTYALENAEILYEGVSEEGEALSDSSVISYASSLITADGIGRAIVKTGDKKYLIKTKKANIALVLLTGQSNAAGAESDASLAPSALGKYKGRFFITNSMNQAVSLSDITWEEARYEAEHGGAPSSTVAKGGWVETGRGAGTASSIGKRLSDEWNMTVWVVNTGFGGHPMEGFDPTKATHSDYTNTVNIVKKVKEVIASDRHYVVDNAKTGMFWIQGCSDGIGTDSENTMAEYKAMFMNMYNGFKTELGINYAGIWLVRAGTYNNGDKDFYMSGPRMAQLYMANSNAEEYKNIHLVFNPDIWRTNAGVEGYFKAQYPDAEAFLAEFGYDRPSTVNEVKPDIHYRQKGYNELGDVAGRVMSDILEGSAAKPADAELYGYDGNKIPDTGFELEAEETAIAVPFVTSHYYNASANLTVTVANTEVATYDNETFTLNGVAEGETSVSIYAGTTLLKTYPVKVSGGEEKVFVCYIGEDEASRIYYESIHEAMDAASIGSTIYVTADIVWDDVTTYQHKKLTIKSDGTKKKLTVTGGNLGFKGTASETTFENITIDFDFSGKRLLIDDGATVNLIGADVINGKGGVGGTVAIGSGMNGHLIMDENSVISGRATENAAVGAVVHLHGANGESTFTMNGGKIINYDSSATRFAVATWNTNSTITIGKNATIVNGTSTESTPVTGKADAISIKNENQLILKGDFTGSIKVKCAAAGNTFGIAESGAKISGSLKNYSTGASATVDNGKLIWITVGDCYIGNNSADKMSLSEAIEKAPSGSVIHLVRDVTLEETLMLNRIGVSLTVDGTKGDGMYKIEFPITEDDKLETANKRIFHIRNGHLTLNNVILSGGIHKDYGGSVIVEEASCSLTLTGKTEIRGAKATNGGALWVRKGTLTIKDDALITENTAQIHGGAIYLTTTGGKVTLEGGKVTGNYAPGGGGIYAGRETNIYLKNDAYVYGNIANKETNAESNIIPENAEIIVLNDSFTGKAGISFGKLKETFGKMTGGSGEYNLISDAESRYYGYAEDGKLIWIPGQLKLSTEADAGTKADGSVIIRFITNFDKAENLNALSYGTYIIPESLFADFEKDVYTNTGKSLKAYFVSAEKGGVNYKAPATGTSFGVDYVEIPSTAFAMEFVAVSFINLDGTYIYIRHGDVSVEGFGQELKALE